ncbi:MULTISPECIES: hypothetical protein [unclassified Pseudoalteromonas]|uniref:hypothetical protein n=1 Tax=unclassified Pseudoalteromonas TaxID=194690 RepID=UPI0018CF249E|nr:MULTISPECIES: hypothetical protein [unclassified Pseudoalteromonas]MBG9991562.1 hypothetical protein [Pseudoalteromonas sp. NZS37]MBH0088638.1 hypothetical protein [Pseudoalteromonas sp. NSLLW218]
MNNRFIVENTGPNQGNLELAFYTALEVCKGRSLTNIIIVFPTKQGFKNSIVANFLGKQATKTILDGGTVNAIDGIKLTFRTPKNIDKFSNNEVIFAIYTSEIDMNLVDSARSEAIVFLPWREDEGKDWLAIWNPKIIGPTTWAIDTDVLSSEAQEVILSLGRSINMSTGLTHPSDKDLAKRLFSSLRNTNTLTPELVKRFAIQNGWEPLRAQELAVFSEKYC